MTTSLNPGKIPPPRRYDAMKRAAQESERQADAKPVDGYWVAPTLRGQEAVKPRMKAHLKLREESEPLAGAAGGGVDPARQVAQLAEELQRFSATLASLLPALAEGGEQGGSGRLESSVAPTAAPPVPVSVRPHLPKRRQVFKPRVFRPGGIVEAPDPASLKAHLSRGKLIYPCPACHAPTEIAATYAGEGIRCPHCYSAVRAPDPSRRLKARNLEQDVQTLLKPSRYAVVPFAASRRLPVPLPKWTRKLPVVNIAACLMLGMVAYPLVILSLKPWVQMRQPERFEPVAEMVAPPSQDPNSLRQRAENVVRGFLAAPVIDVKASYVRSADRVLPIMQEYYGTRPEELSADFLTIDTGTPSYHLSSDYHHVATDVAVQFANFGEVIFRVEHLPEGDLIEWESSMGYNPIEFARALGAGTQLDGLQTFRVLAVPDDYFNYEFDDPSKYLCVRLIDPEEEGTSAFGYVDKRTMDAREIDFLLNQRAGQGPRPIMLELRFHGDTGKTRQVEITRLVERSWRSNGEESIEPASVVAVAEVLDPSYELTR